MGFFAASARRAAGRAASHTRINFLTSIIALGQPASAGLAMVAWRFIARQEPIAHVLHHQADRTTRRLAVRARMRASAARLARSR